MAEMVPLGPARRLTSSLKDIAEEDIRRRILSGDLRPGSRVDQDAVAAELGISKVPVREALISLAHEGLVDQVARRGVYVAALTRDDIRDHYVVFGLVSGLAAERAAAVMTAAHVEALEILADRMEHGGPMSQQDSLNFEFHRMINRASASRRLTSLIHGLARLTPHGWFESHEGWVLRSHAEHRAIVDALKVGDGEGARAAVAAHFAAGGDVAVERLEVQGYWRD